MPALREDGSLDTVHAMASFHGTLSFAVPFAQLGSTLDALMKLLMTGTRSKKRLDDWGSMIRYLVTERIKNPPSERDLFSAIH